ncbi:MAG: hypothetical protein ACT4QB_10815 [Gammaproteobacteria bacterium]
MRATREIYDALPDTIAVPEHLRHRRVEIIMLPLDEELRAGWPPGFFEATAGAWQGESLERAPQGDFEQRETLK